MRALVPASIAAVFVLACGGAQEAATSAEIMAENTVEDTGGSTGDETATAGDVDTTSLNAMTESYEVAGIDVIHKHTPANATVAVRLFIDGGVAMSDPALAGAEQLAIGVVTAGGPASMDKVDYAAAVEAMGSSIGGSADYDYAVLSMGSIETYFEPTWELFASAILEPAWRESDIELRRELALTGLRTEMDSPDGAAGIAAKELAFEGHAYETRPQGRIETVEALGAEELDAVWGELLVKSRLTLVVVGNVDRATVERLVTATLGDLPEGPDPATGVERFDFTEPRLRVVEREGLPTNYVLGYFAGPPVDHPDYPALQAALEILSDRLFEEVRTRRNLSYAVASGISERRAVTGFLYVTAEQANTTLQVMFDTIDGMIEPRVDEQSLHDQIEGYLTRYYMGLQSNGAQASLLGHWELRGGGRENADVHVHRLAEVDADDVARVLDEYLRDIQFVVVGDPSAIDEAVFTSR